MATRGPGRGEPKACPRNLRLARPRRIWSRGGVQDPADSARRRMIDVLRGVAALGVALFHFNTGLPELPDAYHRAVQWGWLGVPVFFVVSGYCVAEARRRDGRTRYWLRRLARILPPYWASVGLVLALVGLRLADLGVNDYVRLPRPAVDGLYMAFALVRPASGVEGLNPVYWTLGYEIAFYVILGLLGARWLGWGAAGVSAVAPLLTAFPFDLWGLFALGVGCHCARRGERAAAVVLALVNLAHVALNVGLAQAAAGAAAAALIVFPPGWILRRGFGVLERIGGFSYSLYLIHVPVGCYLLRWYLPWPFAREFWPSVAHDALTLVATLVAAWAFHRAVEAPSHRLARRIGGASPAAA